MVVAYDLAVLTGNLLGAVRRPALKGRNMSNEKAVAAVLTHVEKFDGVSRILWANAIGDITELALRIAHHQTDRVEAFRSCANSLNELAYTLKEMIDQAEESCTED